MYKIKTSPEYILHIKFINPDLDLNYKEIIEATGNSGYDIYVKEDTIIKSTLYETEKLYTQIGSNIKCEMLKIYNEITIEENQIVNIKKIITNSGFLLLSRSSLSNLGLSMPHSVGLIDSSYRGEILGRVFSFNKENTGVNKNDRLFQIVAPDLSEFKVKFVEELSNTARGSGGFGSTNN
jgi:dUTP pyrophosphatase